RLLWTGALFFTATPSLWPQQPTPGERLPVVKYVLPNGMTFLFLRRPGAPTVSFVTHFRAGGVDEWTGISGTAHLFEHMLFKGTPRSERRTTTPSRLCFRGSTRRPTPSGTSSARARSRTL